MNSSRGNLETSLSVTEQIVRVHVLEYSEALSKQNELCACVRDYDGGRRGAKGTVHGNTREMQPYDCNAATLQSCAGRVDAGLLVVHSDAVSNQRPLFCVRMHTSSAPFSINTALMWRCVKNDTNARRS